MHELALAIGFVLGPLALIPRAIRPELGTVAISEAIEPLARVGGSILHGDWALGHSAMLVHYIVLPGAHIVALGSSTAEFGSVSTCLVLSVRVVLLSGTYRKEKDYTG